MPNPGLAIKLLSTLAVQGALPRLVSLYEAETGNTVDATLAPTHGVLERIAAGETADMVIVTRSALDDLVAKGVIRADSVVDVAVSRVGIAVQSGAPKPDISSVDALKATLLAASSVAYSRIGASGVFFGELIRRLGIAEAVNAKAIITSGGLTGEVVARCEAELAVQQLSELMAVPGIEVVGSLPPGAESVTMFSAGVFAGAAQAEAALLLARSLQATESKRVLAASGLQPA